MNRTPPPDTTPSFEKSAKPLSLALKPSPAVKWFLIVAHLLAVIAALISAIPLPVKLLLTALVAASLTYNLKQNNKPTHLVWRPGNRWFINEAQLPAELTAINFFSRWLVIVTLQQTTKTPDQSFIAKQKQKQKFLIPYDAVDEETFRLLRVRLRIEGHDTLNPPEDTIK